MVDWEEPAWTRHTEDRVVAAQAMAKGLGLSVVAEGIETTDQLDFLCRHGCPEGQGFLMSRPVGADAIALQLEQAPTLLDIRRAARRPAGPLDGKLLEADEAVVTTRSGEEEAIRPLLVGPVLPIMTSGAR